ncbi:MAG: hypothetical protein KAW89_04645, partial [Armatimonadetes bacterium]|nr:hypothetical protein [Armatimonadota bacterium]
MIRLWTVILLLIAVSAVVAAEPVNLKEFFPFGMWLHGDYLTTQGLEQPTVAGDMAALGLNFASTLANTDVAPDSDDPRSVASILKLAQQHNLKVALRLTPLHKDGELAAMPPNEAQQKLAPFVAEARKYPSLLGWHIAEEPRGEKLCKAAERMRQVFAQLDPDHPGWTEGGWGVLERDVVPQIEFIKQDVYQPEVYPVWNRPFYCGIGDFRFAGFKRPPREQQGPDDWITVDLVDHYREFRPLLRGRHIWPWIQCHRQWYEPPDWSLRGPTPEEVRCLTWISVAEGCKGLCWFSHDHLEFFGGHVRLFPEIKSLVAAIRPITDILLNSSVVENLAQVRGGGSRYYGNGLVETLRDTQGVFYAVVVNRNCEPRGDHTLTVQVRGPLPGGSRTLLAVDPVDNSVIATHRGTPLFAFSVRLRPGEGRLIRLIHAPDAANVNIKPGSETLKVGQTID